MNKRFLLATMLLAGTIIGAGIFSLPYVFSRVGIGSGFFYLIGFASVYFLIHWMYVNILNAQTGEHQFFYLAGKYFKASWSRIASFVILGELVLVLTVYLILAPAFLKLVFNLTHETALLIFWFVGSIFIFVRLSWQAFAETAGTLAILLVAVLVFGLGGTQAPSVELFKNLNLGIFFLPFGPLLFSLAGRPALHKVMEEYRRSRAAGRPFSLTRVVFWGTAIPAIIYFIFVIGVLRLNPNVSPDVLSSLGFLPAGFLGVLGILGFFALWTSYFMIGVNVRDIFKFDLKYPPFIGTAVVLLMPLLLYMLGLQNFLETVSFTGGVFLALESIFVITMWRHAFGSHPQKWLSWPLYVVFVTAIIYELIHFLA